METEDFITPSIAAQALVYVCQFPLSSKSYMVDMDSSHGSGLHPRRETRSLGDSPLYRKHEASLSFVPEEDIPPDCSLHIPPRKWPHRVVRVLTFLSINHVGEQKTYRRLSPSNICPLSLHNIVLVSCHMDMPLSLI